VIDPADTASQADNMNIRAVERADLLDILRIERASFENPWPYQAFLSALDDPVFLAATAAETANIHGYIIADIMPNHGRDRGHIKDLAVAPSARQKGIGRTLLWTAIRQLAATGAVTIKLEVRAENMSAQSLYESVGFEVSRRVPRYYDDGEDALILILDLESS
jgi:[SSU ribosomal protein S18P]-alanine acetyltransferase (EC 2.3.1.128)